MRYGTDEAARQIVVRSARIRRRALRRKTGALSGLSSCLAALLIASFRYLSPLGATGMVSGAYGSYLLPSEAGGYVLIGVISFASGVAVTVAFLRRRGEKLRDTRRFRG